MELLWVLCSPPVAFEIEVVLLEESELGDKTPPVLFELDLVLLEVLEPGNKTPPLVGLEKDELVPPEEDPAVLEVPRVSEPAGVDVCIWDEGVLFADEDTSSADENVLFTDDELLDCEMLELEVAFCPVVDAIVVDVYFPRPATMPLSDSEDGNCPAIAEKIVQSPVASSKLKPTHPVDTDGTEDGWVEEIEGLVEVTLRLADDRAMLRLVLTALLLCEDDPDDWEILSSSVVGVAEDVYSELLLVEPNPEDVEAGLVVPSFWFEYCEDLVSPGVVVFSLSGVNKVDSALEDGEDEGFPLVVVTPPEADAEVSLLGNVFAGEVEIFVEEINDFDELLTEVMGRLVSEAGEEVLLLEAVPDLPVDILDLDEDMAGRVTALADEALEVFKLAVKPLELVEDPAVD
ncbi:hypothetical protein CAC42_792 [Sphaceloma murrayae]|uniref:Uncharacterized protein n=1 Tax=Sphaceloma murrayae TaxID=2082308 RepID=A0A2K1QL44_9PEZI|nr:hypothetical protein CAC42_792 [Sphaceloma murrayae]